MSIKVLHTFATNLKTKFSLPGTANPEDQLKSPVGDLVAAIGKVLGATVATKTEAQLSEHSVRPDIAAYSDGLICGYIELKQPGLGADAPKLKSKHNKEQWEKLKNLPNLLYTDGREWALYRGGERVGALLRFHDDPSQVGVKAIDDEDVKEFEKLIRDFLFWTPHVPHKPTELAAYLAPLTRFLRSEVEAALLEDGSAVSLLAAEWRNFFFPDADNAQFADAYAQTITYALLLARLSGAEKLSPIEAAKTLDKGNGLLARTLELLGQTAARDELRVGFELLQRSIEALNPAQFMKGKPDLWLYFYEDFLAAYDRKLRNDYGVYYTPREVVGLQVRLAAELLEKRFNKKLSFADDGVVFLDPAVGTGTYLVSTVAYALDKVRERSGEGAVAGRASQMAENMYGFEILVGPYAVAHLRLKQAIESVGGSLPTVGQGANAVKRLKVYLADTLASPFTTPPGGLDLTHRKLTEEREAARKIKQTGEILVCLGNPPYDRQRIEEGDEATHRKGGWVRFGDQIKGGAKQEEQNVKPIFEDFLDPARRTGHGVYLQVMYNDYLYFWRWALWRLFEQQKCGGIITFITASSYLTGPGFVGVREVMRRTFDELWIIDLGGDNLGTRKTPNVFNIQTPVAVAVGLRGPKAHSDTPANVHYVKVTGATREEKLLKLDSATKFADFEWQQCPTEWQQPFRPIGAGDYFQWPELKNLFPWQYNGTQWFRGWTVAPTRETLVERLKALVSASGDEKQKLFRVSAHRNINSKVKSGLPGGGGVSLANLTSKDIPQLNIMPFAWRSFDRQWAIYDARFGDRLREPLWKVLSKKQLFLITLMATPLGQGPGINVAINIPDCHYFRGSYGGRDIFPIWRDAEATQPNVTAGLLSTLSKEYGRDVNIYDFVAYVYALLGGQSYTARFWNELETPGGRVPITKDESRFSSTVTLGKRLIWLHTYGERFQPKNNTSEIPAGLAKCITALPSDPAKYPERFEYNPILHELHVGEGRFAPISTEVWEFEISGLKVVQSWLGYRMKVKSGKKSSPLDDIRPDHWTPRMTDELLELLWVLEATVDMEPELSAALDLVIQGPCFNAEDLPQPTDIERKSPVQQEEGGDLLSIMGVDEGSPEED